MSESRTEAINTYKNAHLWLIIPLILTLAGFFRGYFMNFINESWHKHMHGLSAILWYILLIIQPYLVTRKQILSHKKYGMIALILAGGVVFSAITIIPMNIQAALATEEGDFRVFLYGISFVDFISVVGFCFSVIMAIINVKSVHDHALWMISTAFWPLFAGLVRLIGSINSVFLNITDYHIIIGMYISAALIMPMIIITCIRLKKWHMALILPLLSNLLYFTIRPLGESEVWRNLAESIFKY